MLAITVLLASIFMDFPPSGESAGENYVPKLRDPVNHGMPSVKSKISRGYKRPPSQSDSGTRLVAINQALNQMSFPYDNNHTLRIKLNEEISVILTITDVPERDLMFAKLAERFISQFSSIEVAPETFVMALETYETVLSGFGHRFGSDSLAYESILENIVNLAETDQGKALLRERLATLEYASRKSELLGRAAGVLISQRLKSIGSEGLEEVQKLEANEIRFQAERSVLTNLVHSNATDAASAVSFFLSDKSKLSAERSIMVRLIGAAFNAYPTELSDVVFSAPKGAKRDAALFQMAIRMNRNDFEAAQAWISEISDASLKKRAQDDFKSKESLMIRHTPASPSEWQADPFAGGASQ